MLTLEMILAGKYFYNATSPACLAPPAYVRKGSASYKYKQSAPKVGTKS